MTNLTNHPTINLILFGESHVGKSSFMRALAGESYSETYQENFVNFYLFSLKQEEKNLDFKFIDGSGQARFKTLCLPYAPNTTLVLCFDLTNRSSFACLNKQLKSYCRWSWHDNCQPLPSIVLLGMKSDLVEKREVSQAEIDTYLAEHPSMRYVETSAKENTHLDAAFKAATSAAMENHQAAAKAKAAAEQPKTCLPTVQTCKINKSCFPSTQQPKTLPSPGSLNFKVLSAYLLLGIVVGTVVGCAITALTLNPAAGFAAGMLAGTFTSTIGMGTHGLFRDGDKSANLSSLIPINYPQTKSLPLI